MSGRYIKNGESVIEEEVVETASEPVAPQPQPQPTETGAK